ncbi:hypothetical protein ACWEQL_26870 [Kitasatospora sp. NPDC004240]
MPSVSSSAFFLQSVGDVVADAPAGYGGDVLGIVEAALPVRLRQDPGGVEPDLLRVLQGACDGRPCVVGGELLGGQAERGAGDALVAQGQRAGVDIGVLPGEGADVPGAFLLLPDGVGGGAARLLVRCDPLQDVGEGFAVLEDHVAVVLLAPAGHLDVCEIAGGTAVEQAGAGVPDDQTAVLGDLNDRPLVAVLDEALPTARGVVAVVPPGDDQVPPVGLQADAQLHGGGQVELARVADQAHECTGLAQVLPFARPQQLPSLEDLRRQDVIRQRLSDRSD